MQFLGSNIFGEFWWRCQRFIVLQKKIKFWERKKKPDNIIINQILLSELQSKSAKTHSRKNLQSFGTRILHIMFIHQNSKPVRWRLIKVDGESPGQHLEERHLSDHSRVSTTAAICCGGREREWMVEVDGRKTAGCDWRRGRGGKREVCFGLGATEGPCGTVVREGGLLGGVEGA